MRLRAAALLLFVVVGCHARREQGTAPEPKPLPPDALYARGREALQRGDNKAAERIAHEGEVRFAAQPVWRERFTILEAESLRNPDVLAHAPTTGDPLASVRRLIQQRKYDEADALAARVAPELQAEIAYERGKASGNEDSLRQAIAGTKQPWLLARAYGQLAAIAMRKEQWPRAIDDFTSAIKYAQTAQMADYEKIAKANRGWCRLETGDLDDALKDLRPAAEQQSNLFYQHLALVNIGEVYERRLEFDEAMKYAQQALEVAKKRGDKIDIANSFHQLGQLEFERGNYAAAKSWNDKALQERPANDGKGMLSDRWTDARIVAKSNPVKAIEMMDGLLASKDDDLAFRWRVRWTEAEILHKSLGRLPEAEQKYKEALTVGANEREKVQGSDSALTFERNLLSIYDGYIDLLTVEGRHADALRVAEQSRARALREGTATRSAAAVDPVALARATNATILYYWVQAKRSLLWTVTPRGIDVATLPGEDEIDKAADAYREELQTSRRPPASSALGVELYEKLVAPARSAPGSRVIISPDAHLRALSFDALIVPAPARHYWIEDVTISYAPSLDLLAAPPRPNALRNARALVLGDVPADGREFPKLTLAQAEIQDIVRHFDRAHSVVLSGTRATPESYAKADLRQFQIIHFAAHAFAANDAPLDSAIVLASGRLNGRQIMKLQLDAELVTLSSCNSAGRRNYAGEGLVGLTWAFLHAGARRVVAAQWEVSDSAAPLVMDRMYDAISAGVEPAEALRRAKLSLLRSRSIFERPLYWAPFGIYGAF